MEGQYTLDQLLLGIRRVIDYIGEEKFEQLLNDEISSQNTTDESTTKQHSKLTDQVIDEIRTRL